MWWGAARRFVAVLGPFVVRALLINKLGVDYLGLSSFYTSLLQILNLAELGFSTAVAYGMYEPIARGDSDMVARYLNYLRRVYHIIGVSLLLGGLVLIPALSFLISGTVPSDVNLGLAFIIFLANTALGYVLFAHKQTLLQAHQRKDLVDKVGLATLVAQFVLQSAVLVLAPNFYTYAIVLPLCTIASNLILSKLTQHYYPQYTDARIRELELGEEERKDMRVRIVGLVLQKACMITRDPFAGVVISAFVGLGAIARFGNYLSVVGGLLGLLGVIGMSMTASVGNSIALESPEKNTNDLRLFVFLYAFASIVCAAVLLACFQPFMALWVGDELVLPFGFAISMVVYFYIRTMGDMRTVYVDATGVWWKLRWRALAETIANLVLCLVCTRLWSIQGTMVALCTSLFVFNFLYGSHLVFKLYFGLEKARDYYLDHAAYALAALIICALVYALASLVPADTWALLVLRAFVAGLCASVMATLLFYRSKQFKRALEFLRMLKA